jgi:hypothetical protein
MSCSRCHGLMVKEHFLDFDGTIGHMWASGHRCMNCGNVHDPVIEQHRLVRTEQMRVPLSPERYTTHNEFHVDTEAVIRPAA